MERPAGRTILTPGRPARQWGGEGSAGVTAGWLGHWGAPPGPGWSCLAVTRPVPGAQPYLGARSVLPGSGDMMRDGVPRWGWRPLILGRLRRAGLAAGWRRERAASSSVIRARRRGGRDRF